MGEYDGGREGGSIIVRVRVSGKGDIVVGERKGECGEGEYGVKDRGVYLGLMKGKEDLIEVGELKGLNGNCYKRCLKGEYGGGEMVEGGVGWDREGGGV